MSGLLELPEMDIYFICSPGECHLHAEKIGALLGHQHHVVCQEKDKPIRFERDSRHRPCLVLFFTGHGFWSQPTDTILTSLKIAFRHHRGFLVCDWGPDEPITRKIERLGVKIMSNLAGKEQARKSVAELLRLKLPVSPH